MTGRKSAIAAAVLCALVLCAVAASNASAGALVWKCSKLGPPADFKYADAHCKNKTGGDYELLNVGIGSPVAITITNERTASETTASAPTKLRGTLVGIESEVECAAVSGSGSLTNSSTFMSGTATLKFSSCVVNKPAGKGCVVTGGSITTESLTVTTESQTGANVKIQPASGTKLGTVPISSCSVAGLNNSYPVTGSFLAVASGATLTMTHVSTTEQNTLKLGGGKAGIESVATDSYSEGSIVLE